MLAMTLTFAPTASAAVIAGGAGGNCTGSEFGEGESLIANKQGWLTAAGIIANIDPANTGSEDDCDNPGIYTNNGVSHSIMVAENTGCSGNACAQINLGVISCDNWYLGWANGGAGCDRNVWHYYAWLVEEDGYDLRIDLGTANSPWGQHEYKLFFDYAAHTWKYYIDDVYKGGFLVTASDRDDLDLNISGHSVIAAWQSERWDRGDAFSYNGVNPWDTADYSGMYYYRGGGNWVLPEHINCDNNNRPYPMNHHQDCDGNGFYSQMRVWSVY